MEDTGKLKAEMADHRQISYYREIVDKENTPVIWREVNINTGWPMCI